MKLVQYKGGGYDGCIWEWNFFLLGDNGEFADVASSGYKGITDPVEARRVAANASDERGVYVYDLRDNASILEFARENNPTNIGRVCARVNKILGRNKMFYVCSYCGERVYPWEGSATGALYDENAYHGDGGIGIVFTTVLCEDCFCDRCERCDGIIDPAEEGGEKLSFTDADGNRICRWCQEDDDRNADDEEEGDDA